jgi:hypothetical protein
LRIDTKHINQIDPQMPYYPCGIIIEYEETRRDPNFKLDLPLKDGWCIGGILRSNPRISILWILGKNNVEKMKLDIYYYNLNICIANNNIKWMNTTHFIRPVEDLSQTDIWMTTSTELQGPPEMSIYSMITQYRNDVYYKYALNYAERRFNYKICASKAYPEYDHIYNIRNYKDRRVIEYYDKKNNLHFYIAAPSANFQNEEYTVLLYGYSPYYAIGITYDSDSKSIQVPSKVGFYSIDKCLEEMCMSYPHEFDEMSLYVNDYVKKSGAKYL